MHCSGWFIVDDALIVGIKKHETLLKRTKTGIPVGALQYESEITARMELGFMRRFNRYPLFTPHARVEHLSWR